MLRCLNKIDNRGMTLLELLIVIVIIVTISSLIVINPRPTTNLEIAARQLVSDLRRAQNMAMAAQVRGTPPLNEYVPCGYGISVSTSFPTSYILFEDFAGIPPAITCPDDNQRDPDASEDIETISLPEGIEMASSENVFFHSPTGERPTPDDITLTVQIQDNQADFKNIIIIGAGDIEIE